MHNHSNLAFGQASYNFYDNVYNSDYQEIYFAPASQYELRHTHKFMYDAKDGSGKYFCEYDTNSDNNGATLCKFVTTTSSASTFTAYMHLLLLCF